jgi:hypothetical protein
MYKAAAVYPHTLCGSYIRKVEQAVKSAYEHGFTEIFTSVHLPEYPFEDQLEAFALIAREADKYGLEMTVDLGGPYIRKVLEDGSLKEKMKQIRFDFIRLDYGFEGNEAEELYRLFDLKGFVLNASIYSEDEIRSLVSALRKTDENMELRACHNFYVLKDTGLDEAFAMRQQMVFEGCGIPVYYCFSGTDSLRGPLHEGLVTIERHRNMRTAEVLAELMGTFEPEGLLMSDEWASDEDYEEINAVLAVFETEMHTPVTIPVRIDSSCREEEKRILLGRHVFRCDSPSKLLRSAASRQMAETAEKIDPGNMTERKRGDVTVVNTGGLRYSGELQVCMCGMPADERFNVIAHVIREEDLLKLACFRKGIEYVFTEEDA